MESWQSGCPDKSGFRSANSKCGKPAKHNGELAEWLNAAVLKTVISSRVSGVRIPGSPLEKDQMRVWSFFVLNISDLGGSPEGMPLAESLALRWKKIR